MRVYISGAITNTSDYMERFEKAERLMCDKGYEVINPAKVCFGLPVTFSHSDYMDVCLTLLDKADAIYLIDGWKNSDGAVKELDEALKKHLMVIIDED